MPFIVIVRTSPSSVHVSVFGTQLTSPKLPTRPHTSSAGRLMVVCARALGIGLLLRGRRGRGLRRRDDTCSIEVIDLLAPETVRREDFDGVRADRWCLTRRGNTRFAVH